MDYLQHVLEKTGGSLFARLEVYSQLVGVHQQTPYNQISKGKFPLPVFKIGKHTVVRAEDLAQFLEFGVQQAPVAQVTTKRGPGRPRKYTDAAKARVNNAKNACIDAATMRSAKAAKPASGASAAKGAPV